MLDDKCGQNGEGTTTGSKPPKLLPVSWNQTDKQIRKKLYIGALAHYTSLDYQPAFLELILTNSYGSTYYFQYPYLQVMKGYFDNESATLATQKDGWLYSGQ